MKEIILSAILLVILPTIVYGQLTTPVNGQQAIITAPKDSKIESLTVRPLLYVPLNGTWAYYNSSSHASGQIAFTSQETTTKFNKYGEHVYAFVADINNKTFTGSYETDGASFLFLCHNRCDLLEPRMDVNNQPVGWSANHIELQDMHHNIIHLIRMTLQNMPVPN